MPRKQKTENIFMFTFTSLYDQALEAAIDDFKDKDVKWLRKVYVKLKKRAKLYPSILAKAKLDACIKMGKEKSNKNIPQREPGNV